MKTIQPIFRWFPAFLLICIGLNSFAQVRTAFTQRTSAFSPTQTIYSINGDYTMIGNTNMTLQNYSASGVNSNSTMIVVDADGIASTNNSSSSTLSFSTENQANPSCSRVLFAGLYWSARTNGTPTELQKRSVKFRGPGQSNYTSYTATTNDIKYPGDDNMYVGFAEVTSQVQQCGLGDYWLADMALTTGNGGSTGYYGGWGLVVVYENSKMNKRDVTLFDGYAYVVGGTAQWELPVSGFTTALSGSVNTKLGMMAGEGDITITGDKFEIQKLNSTNWELLGHGGNSSSNFFNSSIFTGGNTRNPNVANNTGMDISMFSIPNPSNSVIGNGQTSTKFRYSSTQDTYIIYSICMAVDAYEPVVEGFLSTLNVNGVPTTSSNLTVQPGDNIQYKVQIRNKGNEAINNARIEIPLPYAAIRYQGSSVNVFSPASSSALPYVDATLGANGTLIWDFGTLPLPSNPNTVLGELTFTLKVTEDCELYRNFNCSAPNVQIDGTISGIGANTGISVDDQPFYVGFSNVDGCSSEPLTGPFNININSTEWVTANCAASDGIRDFTYCNRTTAIPVTDVIGFYPNGTRFFNANQTVEYTVANPFPILAGPTTYRALLPGTSCLLSFTIGITTISSLPTVSASTLEYCKNNEALALIATPSNPTYQLFYYAPGSSIAQPLLIPSTLEAGNFVYQVAEGPSSTCISTIRKNIPVQINALPTISATATQIACFGGTGSVELTSNGGTGNLTYSLSNPATSGLTAASYTYSISDSKGCEASATAVINAAPAQPAQPSLACYQTATWNVATCSWDVTGTQAPAPTTACYETATFNTSTCGWDVTGTQAPAPTTACYETATFNTLTCGWDVTGTQPSAPTTACYETAIFNTSTCGWDVTGTQAPAPTTACYETATFNTSTCGWDVTGTQAPAPTTACYETATFNTLTCGWDVTGTQAPAPTTACYETATFNTLTCGWDVTGTQAPAPTNLSCWQTATFNTTSCDWDVTGTQESAPTNLSCWQTATFNTTSCDWDVTGTQEPQPTNLSCWQTANFNTTSCNWDVTGTQTPAPTNLECYQSAVFNNTTCSWDVSGTSPVAITSVTGDSPLCVGATALYNANGVVLGGGLGAWSSSNLSVASVDASSGSVTALGAGNTNIVYTITAPCGTASGRTWATRTSASDLNWQSVAYNGSKFVAVGRPSVGNTDAVMTSEDGDNWTNVPHGLGPRNFNDVIYANNMFVAVSSDVQTSGGTRGAAMYSANGNTWTLATAPRGDWQSVAYGNGTFVAVASFTTTTKVMTSTDGINWTSRTPSSTSNIWRGVTFGNGLFVAVSTSGTANIMTSPNGINWTAVTPPGNAAAWAVAFGNEKFVAVSQSGAVMTSTDGSSWTIQTSAVSNAWNDVTFADGVFVAVASSGTGNRIMTSADGIIWLSEASAADNKWNGITYGNGKFVVVGETGTGNRVMVSSVAAGTITVSAQQTLIVNPTPAQPTNLSCWQTATFNTASCSWNVTGTQAPAPTNLSCWESASFNTGTCSWDVTGTQPAEPGTPVSLSSSFDISSLPGYGVATSALFNFNAAGGWAGWSVPAGKVVLGAKIISTGDNFTDFAVFRPASPGQVFPHYTYGANEYGWVMQAKTGQSNNGVQIEVYYADALSNYAIIQSNQLNYNGAGGYGGWSAPAGDIVSGGGYQFNNSYSSAAISALAVAGSSWPHIPNGVSEQGWVVRGPSNNLQNPGRVYVISFDAPSTQNCWDNYVFNNVSCQWENIGTQPSAPTNLSCWQTATFNTSSCDWDVTGTQAPAPTNLDCWQTATFNTTSCDWDVTGTQAPAPTNLDCWQTATFNTTSCGWDVTGTQPVGNFVNPNAIPTVTTDLFSVSPSVEARARWGASGFEAVLFTPANPGPPPNGVGLNLDPSGAPIWGDGLTRNFKFTYNPSTGASNWSIDWNNNLTFGTGEIISSSSSALVNKGFNYVNIFLQGANVNAPATGASVTVQNLSINGANFGTFSANNSTVVSQNIKNSSGVFGDITVTGNITFVNGPGTLQERPRFWIQLGQPVTLQTQNCWDNYVFNNVSCQWENIGTQPSAPTILSCWQTATFNTTSCAWDVTGTQEPAPTNLSCWESALFNTETCGWDVTGTQAPAPTNLACWQTATFNTTSCGWDVSGTQAPAPTNLSCWQTATFNTTSCAWDVTGTQAPAPTNLACWQTATFNTTSCSWVVTGTQPQAIVTNASACGSYTWAANSQQYTSSGTYSYSANCQDYSLNLTINNSSVAASSISTASTSVNPSATFTLSVVGGSLGTSATWKWYKTSCGGTAIGTGASISVSQTVATTYFVRAEGTCGMTDCKSITVNMNCGPTSITSNRPANTVCKGTSITLTVQGTVGTGGSWKWYKGGCGVGTICATGSSITVTPSANTTYFVRSTGSTCGTTVCQSISVIVNSAPATPGTISGSTVGLCGATAAQYSVAPVSGATTYTWTVPTGAVITAGQGTNVITVNFAGASNSSCSSSSTISVKASNSCGTSSTKTLTIGLRPAKATAINGSASACKLSVVTYSVNPIAGATSYTWTVPTGWIIQAGQGTANVTIKTGSCTGSIGVTANSICGNNGSFTRSITLSNCARYAEDNSASEEEITAVDDISVYPNPGFGEYTIVTPSLDETAVVSVFAMDGRLVSTLNVPAQSKTIELHLNDVAKGIYLVRFVSTSLSQDIRVIKQ